VNLSLGVRVLVIVVCALFSVIVGIGAGWLHHHPGARKRDAVLYGGVTFGGTLTLCVLVLGAVGVLSGGTA
jgi:hypothetical protein